MTITEKLALMKEIEARNNERWGISSKERNGRQTAAEYSARETMMRLYVM